MARIARILCRASSTFSKLLLRWILFALIVVAAAIAVVGAGLPDKVLRGDRSDFLALLVAGGTDIRPEQASRASDLTAADCRTGGTSRSFQRRGVEFMRVCSPETATPFAGGSERATHFCVCCNLTHIGSQTTAGLTAKPRATIEPPPPS